MDNIKNTEYYSGNIFEITNEEETLFLNSIYNNIIDIKNNKDLVTYLYSTEAEHPNKIESGYYNNITSNEIDEYIKQLKNPKALPHQKNKIIDKYELVETRLGLEDGYLKTKLFNICDKLAIKIVNNLYNKNLTTNDLKSHGQLTWYTKGDFIKMHTDGYSSDRICVILIYLTPEEYYKPNSGGELVLKNKYENVKVIAPILGNYSVLDFTENSPLHAVNMINDDFNRFAYLHFITPHNYSNITK
jgi:Rps23 Pro-64 3,4-dihydroxylase Tpa1-like proline 4-hydroxylase